MLRELQLATDLRRSSHWVLRTGPDLLLTYLLNLAQCAYCTLVFSYRFIPVSHLPHKSSFGTPITVWFLRVLCVSSSSSTVCICQLFNVCNFFHMLAPLLQESKKLYRLLNEKKIISAIPCSSPLQFKFKGNYCNYFMELFYDKISLLNVKISSENSMYSARRHCSALSPRLASTMVPGIRWSCWSTQSLLHPCWYSLHIVRFFL